MNGLLDKKAKQQAEFMKNPKNIDDALDEVVKYWEACQVSSKDVGARHHPLRVARTSPGDSSESDEDGSGSDTEVNPRVARSFGKQPSKGAHIQFQNKQSQPATRSGDNRGLSFTMDGVKSLVATETQKCLDSIQEILDKSSNGSSNQGQWVKAKSIIVREAGGSLEGVEVVEEDIIGLDLTTQHFNVIAVTR